MSIDSPGKITSEANQGKPNGGFLGLLRVVSLVAALVGAVGSVVFLFRASQHPTFLVIAYFIIWVISPFAILLSANLVSSRWPVVIQVTLCCVTLVVMLGSMAIYSGLVNVKPPGSANAFLFVAIPPASWVFMAVVISLAALISSGFSRRVAGA